MLIDLAFPVGASDGSPNPLTRPPLRVIDPDAR
jgi:hypothetical protein